MSDHRLHVTAEVDKDWEISAVCRHTFRTIPEQRRPALMFDRIKGSAMPFVVGILGGSRRIYATALETDLDGVWEKWERSKNPLPPRVSRLEHDVHRAIVCRPRANAPRRFAGAAAAGNAGLTGRVAGRPRR